MRTVLSALVDLVLPRVCVACRRPDESLCADCAPPALWWADADPPVTAAGLYDAGLRTALLAYKERDRRDLAGALGRHLARAVAVHLPAEIVPVPSTPAARRRRGGDHVLRLARRVSRECDASVADALRLVRAVDDSAGLDSSGRAANLSGAMAARPGGTRRAVLVDDIATTGTTLREAVRALRSAGWEVTGAAVVAATLRRSQPVHSGGSLGAGLAWVDLNE